MYGYWCKLTGHARCLGFNGEVAGDDVTHQMGIIGHTEHQRVSGVGLQTEILQLSKQLIGERNCPPRQNRFGIGPLNTDL